MGHGYGAGRGAGLRGRTSVPTVRPASPAVQGSLNVDVIRRVVQRNLGQVRRCYELALRANPALTGRMGVRFVIGADGRVIGVEFVNDTVRDAGVHACVRQALLRWVFPAPQGTVRVTYPFNLSP